MEKSSRIYVAGHSGLIGSAMLSRLKAEGYGNIITAAHGELELTDKAAVDAFFHKHKPEYVVLAAGKVGGIVENKTKPADFLNTNLAIQLNVFNATHRAGVKKLIFFASSCMYPRECAQPMAESALLTGEPEPTSMAYAIAKLSGLQMCLAYNAQYGEKRFIPVIPNSGYGDGDNFNPESGHVLSALIQRFHEAKSSGAKSVTLWGSGAPKREFVHASDIAGACLMLLEKNTNALELPINIGSGSDISIRELAEKIAHIVGFGGAIEWDAGKPDGAPRKLLDSSRIRAFGWQPQIDFDSGLKNTYQWYLKYKAKP